MEFQQMEIVNQRQKMLDAMESNAKGNDNFVIKVISTVNVDGKSYIKRKKKMEEVRTKNQTNFFHFLIYYLERLVYKLPYLK